MEVFCREGLISLCFQLSKHVSKGDASGGVVIDKLPDPPWLVEFAVTDEMRFV